MWFKQWSKLLKSGSDKKWQKASQKVVVILLMHIYIIYAPKHLYKCANILTCTEILSLCAEIYSLCAETHLLCAEIYVLRGNIFIVRGNLFTVCGNLCAVRKYFQVPANFLVCARKLLCPMRGFSASNHFRNATVPWLANWSIVGSFGTLGRVSNASPVHLIMWYLIWVILSDGLNQAPLWWWWTLYIAVKGM